MFFGFQGTEFRLSKVSSELQEKTHPKDTATVAAM
jgi:hypothetical protein